MLFKVERAFIFVSLLINDRWNLAKIGSQRDLLIYNKYIIHFLKFILFIFNLCIDAM